MNSKTIKFFLLLLLGTLLTLSNIYAEGGDKGKGSNTLEKPGSPIRAYMNINFISTIIKNTGITDINVGQDASGLIFPKGSGKTAVYQSGFLWAAQVNDPNEQDPHVGGTVYREGLQSGWIDANGNVIEETDPGVRIWRVRPDVYPGGPSVDLSAEAQDEVKSEADVRSQYELDWTEWPASIGAPYDDIDGNGSYDPNVDVPGVPGANQTIWFVANDQAESKTSNMYGTQPMGIEQQATMWGYSQTGALGNMFFRRYIIINKSDVLGNPRTFDSMYVSMGSDPDGGDSGDDYAGCDTVLSMSFAYNGQGQDAIYGGTCPALGFDFFQGPIVPSPGDSAIYKGKVIYDYKNLPMTAAYYYINTDPTLTDPVQGSYSEGAVRWYRFMKGRIGLNNEPFVDPNTGKETPFTLPGDPVTGQGWVDGQQFAYADRRIGMASGPFTMAPGDTQEVVVAEILAGAVEGVDRLSAVSLLKFYDQIAQVAYDNFFDLPTPPPPPSVTVSALDNQIVLDWGGDQTRVAATENSDSKGYKFQGYNVYQLPTASSSPSEGVRIATYDIVDGVGKIYDLTFDPTTGSVVLLPVQFGNDVGIQRYISITEDAINQTPLVNGIRYYFAVTAYNYNGEFGIVPNNLENPLRIFTIIPQNNNPGVAYGGEFSDTLAVNKLRYDTNIPPSDGMLYPVVIDPNLLTGLDYTLTFETIGDTLDVWHVDRSDGVRVLSHQTDQNADIQSPIADGLQFRVIGAPLDFKGFDITVNGYGTVEGGDYANSYEITKIGSDGIGVSADWYRDVALSPNGGALGIEDPMQAGGGYYFCVAGGANITDQEAAVGRWTRDGANWPRIIPNNYEIRWTTDGQPAGKGLWPTEFHDNVVGGTYDVPLQLWFLGPNLDDSSDDVRMIPVILDNADTVGGPNPPTFGFVLDHQASGGDNDPYSDWIYFYMPEDQTPGDAGYQAFVAASPTTRDAAWSEHIARFILMNWNQNQGGGEVDAWPDNGTVFRIRSNIPNTSNDYFTFTSPAPTFSNSLAQSQVGDINVFPNPYYGFSSEELNKYNRFVTFNHLPAQANMRIFNLAGVLVRSFEKNDNGQFAYWDLNNEYGLPVASGLYIVYIDMPELGTTKVLKVAIIQEDQVLDRF
jgi:hypothetical protein